MVIIWDLEDDTEGNYWHIVVEGHGVTRDEVDEILHLPASKAVSDSSGLPATFGWTTSGKYIVVIYEMVDDDPVTKYPVTAYEVPPPREKP